MRVFSVITLISAVLACGGESPPPPSPESPSARILSLAPHITETIFALGQGERVVGRTDFCQWPSEVEAIPSVGGLLNLDWEQIHALDPDLAILLHSDVESTGAQLERTGIETLAVRSDSIDDVRAGIEAIAARLGCPERGRELVVRMDAELAVVAERLEGIAPRRTLLLIGREPGRFQSLYAAGPSSFVSELAEHAGAVNVLGAALGAYPQISRETIIGTDPEVIIDTCLQGTDPAPEILAREQRLYRDELGGVAAVAAGRVILWTDPRLTIPGPSMPSQIEALARAIHPEAF